WRFEDVTDRAGVGLGGSVSRGAAWVDLDGDDDLDLLVTRHSEPNVFFRNDGDGRFVDASIELGFDAALASHSLAIADIDRDGDLDVYITNYKDRWARDTFAPAERSYDRVVGDDDGRPFIRAGFEEYFRIVDTDHGLQRWEFAQPDEFYRNDDGRLARLSFASSVFVDEDGRPLEVEPDEWGLSARFVDFDLDGDPDLYVCNDINSPDHIWINDGAGAFRSIDRLAVRKTSAASMAVDVSDVDRDGWPDVFVAEMLSLDPIRRKTQVPEADPDPPEPGEIRTRPQVKRNTLQMNRGDGSFAETAYQAGLAASGWTWAALFLDVDLDGFDDLLTTNGTALDWLDGDAQERTQGVTGGDAWRRLRLQFPPLRTGNLAFRNRGDGRFEEVSAAWRFGADEDVSHGLAAGDLDNDGDLDVVVNRLDAPALVLRNDASGHRLSVRLRGGGANTRAIGARVAYSVAGRPEQTYEVVGGGLYLSDSDDRVTFAGAEAEGRLVVWWPGGGETVIEGVESGRAYEVFEPIDVEVGSSGTAATPAADATEEDAAGDPSVWFEDVSDRLEHTHHETFFNEFTRQPLLPIRLAQLGPGISWIDDDRDGDPDLWVGSGRGGEVTRLENRDGRFSARPARAATTGDIGMILGMPSGREVLLGQISYESEDPRAALGLASVIAIGSGRARPLIEGAPGSTGPIAMADYDADGDLDLFVGARAIPTAYPIAPQPRFFLNDGGDRWTPDAVNAESIEGGALVSAAAFSDLDGDGDPDLALATDWGPVRILENEDGRFSDVTEARGLAGLTGRWNGIATGDLNEDGVPDLVATGWGENTEAELMGAGREILHGDLDRNGTYDLLELERRPDGSEGPARRLDQVARGLPGLRRLVATHHAFAETPLDRLLPGGLAGASRLSARELRHTVFLSRDGGYDAHPLPAVAQRAPAFGVAIADLDADGHQDLVLAQNFFATKLGTPRYDAGRGLVLAGDGTGLLEPLPAARSGLAAYGDGRGVAVADFDGDGALDIALGQNGGPTRLFRNARSADGATVRVRLVGPAANPRAIGAAVRAVYDDGAGPWHELQAGVGYWSQHDLTQVVGLRRAARAIEVRWPEGRRSRVDLEPGTAELRIDHPDRVG
ncbi:MAG: CRTAC1 family protein, partial [Gemmatimonadetes bacterium]|nr:CRTAC1 family protein [Gemmatimonadota bacterium]